MWNRLLVLSRVLRVDLRRLWFALRHPAAPGWLKIGTALLVLYLLSPIDVIPDVVPFFGIVDDLVLIPFAIRFLLGRLPEDVKLDADRRAAQ